MSFIARLRGIIDEKGRDRVIVDVNGVGYRCRYRATPWPASA